MPAAGDERERVVVLQEELARRVEAERAAARASRAARARVRDQLHRLVPALSRTALRPRRTSGRVSRSGRVVRLPAEQALGPEPAAVDAIGARGRGRRRSDRRRRRCRGRSRSNRARRPTAPSAPARRRAPHRPARATHDRAGAAASPPRVGNTLDHRPVLPPATAKKTQTDNRTVRLGEGCVPTGRAAKGTGDVYASWPFASDSATAVNSASAASRSSTISCAITSGGGRLSVSSSDSSRSQVMSRLALSRATSSS